jgi:hypothetical protein
MPKKKSKLITVLEPEELELFVRLKATYADQEARLERELRLVQILADTIAKEEARLVEKYHLPDRWEVDVKTGGVTQLDQ